jgi:hypothetical protein
VVLIIRMLDMDDVGSGVWGKYGAWNRPGFGVGQMQTGCI